jgi:tetratricopeptide (TPR) repeat protein
LAPLLEIDHDNWLPFYWAGVAELMQLNLDNARAYLVRACSLDADRAEPWIARAVVEQEAGNYAGSLQLFIVARQRSPALPEILNGIAYSQAMLEQPQGRAAPSTPGPEAFVSQPLPDTNSGAGTATTTAPTPAPYTRPKVSPQSFRNSPALSTAWVSRRAPSCPEPGRAAQPRWRRPRVAKATRPAPSSHAGAGKGTAATRMLSIPTASSRPSMVRNTVLKGLVLRDAEEAQAAVCSRSNPPFPA